jgi:hypothetical protein
MPWRTLRPFIAASSGASRWPRRPTPPHSSGPSPFRLERKCPCRTRLSLLSPSLVVLLIAITAGTGSSWAQDSIPPRARENPFGRLSDEALWQRLDEMEAAAQRRDPLGSRRSRVHVSARHGGRRRAPTVYRAAGWNGPRRLLRGTWAHDRGLLAGRSRVGSRAVGAVDSNLDRELRTQWRINFDFER